MTDYQRGRLDGLREAAKKMCGFCGGRAFPGMKDCHAASLHPRSGVFVHQNPGGVLTPCKSSSIWWVIRHIEAGDPEAIG